MNMHNANINAQQNNGFKPGDRVVCIQNSPFAEYPGEVGKEYGVGSVSYDCITLVGEGIASCDARRFKLVEKKDKQKDEKPSFKPGDVVEYKFSSAITTFSGKGKIGSRVPYGHGCGVKDAWFVEVDVKDGVWAYYDADGKNGNTHRAIPEADLKPVQEVPPFKPGDKFTFRSRSDGALEYGVGPHTVSRVKPRPEKFQTPSCPGKWYVYFGDDHDNQTEVDMIPYVEPTAPFNEATGVLKLSASKPQPFKPGDKVVFKSADHIAKRFHIPSFFKRGITPDTVFTVDEAPARMKLLEGPTVVAIWTDAEIEKARYCNGRPFAYVKTDLLKHHLEYSQVTEHTGPWSSMPSVYIVCMCKYTPRGIELLPSEQPKVHYNEVSAQEEAKRLAAKHPEKRFMVLSSTFAVVNLPVAEL